MVARMDTSRLTTGDIVAGVGGMTPAADPPRTAV
jgi:hypothetical protein